MNLRFLKDIFIIASCHVFSNILHSHIHFTILLPEGHVGTKFTSRSYRYQLNFKVMLVPSLPQGHIGTNSTLGSCWYQVNRNVILVTDQPEGHFANKSVLPNAKIF